MSTNFFLELEQHVLGKNPGVLYSYNIIVSCNNCRFWLQYHKYFMFANLFKDMASLLDQQEKLNDVCAMTAVKGDSGRIGNGQI